MATSGRCPKCDGRMSAGFILDQGHGKAHISTWQSGEPRKSFWVGVKQVKAAQKQVRR